MDINEINKNVVFTDLDVYVLAIFDDLYSKGVKKVQSERLLEELFENSVSYVPCDLSNERLKEIVTKLGTTLAQKTITINEKTASSNWQVTLPVRRIEFRDKTGDIEKIEFEIVGAPFSLSNRSILEAIDRGDLD
ncbi:hypothetical protein [Mammaliicoccus sciuri]|uniref:hypothetical protein n=1 Tax=Mammaliicoccus sciuri TaxID=1296 RepID=UPI0021D32AEF|nr:hypothetical protein [Mammaliicoccus sciuri]UXV14897.1 hypothetical protein MUA89_10050 [Mammaliicoccus sciuri]UXV25938.1 hypothetical protein MUA96_10035 [Mammaliicoccus sciuri]